MNSMSKVVVIGGSGFIGSHIADELSRRGYKVIIFDQVPSPWLQEGQEMVIGDIHDLKAVTKAVKGAKYLYHVAGIADLGESTKRPYDTVQFNIMGTTVALEAAVQANVECFIYASTMYVYSNYGSFYRASKQAAETVIEAYHEKYNIDFTLLRYGSLYGPRAQDWNGLKRYVDQVVRTGKLEYSGTGKERREYIHVLDAARLSVDILDGSHKNQAITVTGHQVLNSEELIDMIFEIAGADRNVIFTEEGKSIDHYTMTPYRYTPKRAKKLVPEEFIDIGQGVLDIVEEIHNELDSQ